MSTVPKDKYKDEGITLCVETIDQIRAFDGISWIHIMGIEWEQVIHEIVKSAGFDKEPRDTPAP